MAKSAKQQLDNFATEVKIRLQNIEQAVDRRKATEVGDQVVALMKGNISKGISPITGKRFESYLHQGVKNKYPANQKNSFPNKKARPVNLTLSGEMINDLISKPEKDGKGYAPRVGYFNEDSKLKEQGHAEGVNGQPKRPTIPTDSGKFSTSIRRFIINSYRKIFQDYLGGK